VVKAIIPGIGDLRDPARHGCSPHYCPGAGCNGRRPLDLEISRINNPITCGESIQAAIQAKDYSLFRSTESRGCIHDTLQNWL
jgi:hypothetical protein